MMHGFARSCIKIRQTDRSDSRVEVGEVPLQAGAGSRGIPQFGLVAEQVEKVNPDLVARDAGGKAYTVRYEAVNAMLLNEFLKEHKAFLEEQRTVEELKKQVAALTAGLQKVNAQLEASKSAPQMVNNP